jgi:hypothetical protein
MILTFQQRERQNCPSVLAAIQFDQHLASGWPGLEFPMRATIASSGRSGFANLPVALVNGARIDLDERGPQDALNAAQRPVLLSGEAYHADDSKT